MAVVSFRLISRRVTPGESSSALGGRGLGTGAAGAGIGGMASFQWLKHGPAAPPLLGLSASYVATNSDEIVSVRLRDKPGGLAATNDAGCSSYGRGHVNRKVIFDACYTSTTRPI